MAEQFLGELRLMSFNYPPKGWAQCNGQLLPINQNQALFALLGTQFGGNGTTNFALPDLRGRVPIHFDGSHIIGQAAGEENHTLTQSEMPQHIHFMNATSQGANSNIPDPTVMLAASAPNDFYTGAGPGMIAMAPATISSIGGSQAHPNMQPFLVMNYCIALIGIFPSRN